MANAFDEFDEPTVQQSGPVKITVPGGNAPGSTGSTPPAGNAFDEFDTEPKKPPSAPIPSAGTLAKDFGVGLLKGVPEAVGAGLNVLGADQLGRNFDEPGGADLAARDAAFQRFLEAKYGKPDPNKEGGYDTPHNFGPIHWTDNERAKAWEEFVAAGGAKLRTDANPNPSPSEYLSAGLSAAHINPEDYFPTPDNPYERIAEAAGSAGIQMLLPGNKTRAVTRLGKAIETAGEVGVGAVGGATGQALAEAAPDDLKPMASLLGNVGGMSAAALGRSGTRAAGRGALAAKDYIAPALPWTDKSKIAAKRLADVVTGDRGQVISNLENAKELVPGSRPSAGKASVDVGVQSFENALARNDDDFKARLIDRQQANSAARVRAAQEIADQSSPSAVSDYFHARMRELETRAEDVYNRHERTANASRDAAVGATAVPAAEVGARGRGALASRFAKLNAETNALWDKLDPDMHVAVAPIKDVVDKTYNNMVPEDLPSVTPIEREIQGIVNDYGDTIPFDRFKKLRSRITTAMREMRREGKNEAYGRLKQNLDGIEEAVGQSIDEQVAREQAAVASGQMRPEDTLANQFLSDAQRLAGNQRDVAGLAAGNAGAGPASEAAISGAPRAEGNPNARPATAPRGAGLPAADGSEGFTVKGADGRVTRVRAKPDAERGMSAEQVVKNRFPEAQVTKDAAEREGTAPREAEEKSTGAVDDQISRQMEAAGRPAKEARSVGAVVQSFYEQIAKWFGRSVEDLSAEYPPPQVIGKNDRVPAEFAGGPKLFQHGEYHPLTALIDHGSLGQAEMRGGMASRIEPEVRELIRDAYERGGRDVNQIELMIANERDLYDRAMAIARDKIGATEENINDLGGIGPAITNTARAIAPTKEAWQQAVGAAEKQALPAPIHNYPVGPTFYSPALKAIEGEAGTKAKKANAQQWMSILKGAPGVKMDELNWLGVEDWLKEQNRPVTQQELADFIRQNQLEVEDTLLGTGKAGKAAIDDWSDLDADVGYREPVDPDDSYFEDSVDDDTVREIAAQRAADYWDADTIAERHGVNEEALKDNVEAYINAGDEHPDGGYDAADEAADTSMREAVEEMAERVTSDARDSEIQSYRDLYYENPDFTQNVSVDIPDGGTIHYTYYGESGGGGYLQDDDSGSTVRSWSRTPDDEDIRDEARQHAYDHYYEPPDDVGEVTGGEPVPEGRSEYDSYADTGGDNYRELLIRIKGENELAKRLARKTNAPMPPADFNQSHWIDKENILAHVRFDTRDIGGKRSVFIQEVQSDWHQAGQKQGYAGPDRAEAVYAKERQMRDAMASLKGKYVEHMQQLGIDQAAIDTAKRNSDETPRYALDHLIQPRHDYVNQLRRERDAFSDQISDLRMKSRRSERAVEWDSRPNPHPDFKLSDTDRKQHQDNVARIANEMDGLIRKLEAVIAKLEAERNAFDEIVRTPEYRQFETAQREYRAMSDTKGVTPGPYADTKLWAELAMKRMLRWAAEHGYDQLVWHPGDLKNGSIISRPADGFLVVKTANGHWSYRQADKDGHAITRFDTITPERFEQTYGKGAAKKVEEALRDKPAMEGVKLWDDALVTHIQTPGYRYGSNIQNFYEKLIPSTIEKLVKKYGSAIERKPMRLQNNDITAFVIPINGKLRESVLSGQPLFQNGERGVTFFGKGNKSLVQMLANADASTGIHEMAHPFLEMYRGLAERSDAPRALRDDWRTTKNWWGSNAKQIANEAGVDEAHVHDVLEKGSSGDDAIDKKVHVALHEQWARAFEKYLAEGQAPTPGLKRVFERFKQWMGQVYQSLTGLNVNLSPEMRGVFDRMLGGDTPAAPRMMDEAQAKKYAAARAATKNLKETFSARPVKDILSREGAAYPYKVTDEGVAGKLWRAGPEGGGQVRQIMDAADNSPEIKQAVTDAAINSLRSAAMKEGRLDPAKVDAWRAKHADALGAVPELDRKLASAASAERTLIEVGQRRAEALKAVQAGAIGKVLKVSGDADVTNTIGGMLNKADAVKSIRELVAEAKNDPDAMAGLRSALVQHMIDRLKTPKDAFRPDTFQRYLGKNAPALAEALTKEQMDALRAIAADLKREAHSVFAPGGGSQTAENLAAAKRYHLQKPTIWGKLWQTMIGPALGGAAGAVTSSSSGWMMQTIGALAGVIGAHVIQRAREAGMETVDDLVREAVLDPKLFAELLKKAPEKMNTGSHISLANRLMQMAVVAGAQAANEQRQQKRFADGGTVSSDVYSAPPAWAADIVSRLIAGAGTPGVVPETPYGVH